MHHPRHARTIRAFRIAALLLIFKRLCLPLAIGLMAAALWKHDIRLAWDGVAALGLTVLFAILQRFLATRCKCPLCMTPLMSRPGCAKHRRATTLLGSYRLPVVISILTRGRFRCPYCHEPTVLRLRDDARRS